MKDETLKKSTKSFYTLKAKKKQGNKSQMGIIFYVVVNTLAIKLELKDGRTTQRIFL